MGSPLLKAQDVASLGAEIRALLWADFLHQLSSSLILQEYFFVPWIGCSEDIALFRYAEDNDIVLIDSGCDNLNFVFAAPLPLKVNVGGHPALHCCF